MKNAIAVLACLLAAAGLAAAQATPGMPIFRLPNAELIKFLDLSATQVVDLAQIDGELNALIIQKATRVAQVRAEIDVETHREDPVPIEIGARYWELENICRESQAAARRAIESARKLLTKDQLTKMQALEQAVALAPVIEQARGVHLLPPGASIVPGAFFGAALASPGFMMSSAGPFYPGCLGPSVAYARTGLMTAP
jgi:hypothetical protein